MNYTLNNLIKKIIPRKFTKLVSDTYQYYSFRGNYKNFKEINLRLTRYDSSKVIRRISNAYKMSINNRFLFDRDGEIVKKKDPNLQYRKDSQCIIDFGGSLANFYRNNLNYLKKCNFKWLIVDNENVCKLGKILIKDNNIFFFDNIENTKKFLTQRKLRISFFLFGSSIQYIENFEFILKEVFKMGVNTIIVDRQPVLRTKATKYVIQRTAPWAGNLSYAVKLYKSQSLINLFSKYGYYLDKNFIAFGNKFLDGEYKTYIFKKR